MHHHRDGAVMGEDFIELKRLKLPLDKSRRVNLRLT